MIILKSPDEIQKIRKASRVVAEVIEGITPMVVPGVTTYDLDRRAAEIVKEKGSKPAFKGYRGFPAVLCLSVNEEVVHGIPSTKKVLKEGDIIGIDCGVIIDGFYGDSAKTLPVRKVDAESEKLLRVTRESLEKGIEQMVVGKRLHDISWAVQSHAESNGFSVVREFVGHGIGRSLHEDPQVPNFGNPNTGIRLTAGMVLAIEPMVNVGVKEVKILEDGWTAVTLDGKRSAHFEHTIALTENGYEILSKL
ncbi:MAG: type I methionyl aminopeptidase [Deltaproteobacteria bacterium]|nr:MAG: type I methionyl aminopeptidase [Deltaproteobacteria bacterium]